MFSRHIAAVLCVSLVAGTIPAEARKKKEEEPAPKNRGARIEGRVVRADGETAVAQATVKFVPLLPDSPTVTAATNPKGWFVAEGIPIGYVDLVVESEGAGFVGNQVINVAPMGRQELQVVLARRGDRTESWWTGREIKPLPGGGQADGIAELRPKVGGKEFWKSPKGLAVLGGIGAAVLLAIASGGGSSARTTQP
jgi:hypothetical protein